MWYILLKGVKTTCIYNALTSEMYQRMWHVKQNFVSICIFCLVEHRGKQMISNLLQQQKSSCSNEQSSALKSMIEELN